MTDWNIRVISATTIRRAKLVHGPNPPFNRITNGLPGIEARMPMLVLRGGRATGRMDIHRFVALTSTNAAKLYGLYPRKGTIAIGSDADLAIWDPDREVVMSVDILHDEMDYTPYEGTKVIGWPVVTLLRGEAICREFEFVGRQGAGASFAARRRFGQRRGGLPAPPFRLRAPRRRPTVQAFCERRVLASNALPPRDRQPVAVRWRW